MSRAETFLIPSWLTLLRKECEVERKNGRSLSRSIQLADNSLRTAVWSICGDLRVLVHGVPGQTCRLLERYLYKHAYIALVEKKIEHDEWDSLKERLKKCIPITIASCAQIAAKMNSVQTQVTGSLIRKCLASRGLKYSLEDILNNEFHVYDSLDFQIPLWTTVQISELLATECGLKLDIHLDAVRRITDLAEYHRCSIDYRIKWAAESSSSAELRGRAKYMIPNFYLSAASVAAMVMYLLIPAEETLNKLVSMTRSSIEYITLTRDVILSVGFGITLSSSEENK